MLALGNLLKDLGKPVAEDMLISKIFSSLPPNYNGIIAAWTNLADADRTVKNLKTRLLQMENIISLQNRNVESVMDKAFFSRTNRNSSSSTSKYQRPEHKERSKEKERNKEHLRLLKENSLCYNCRKPRHWRDECPEPPRSDSKRSEKSSQNSNNRKQSDANTATSQPLLCNSDHDSDCNSAESDSYAFMTISRHSQALSVNLDSRTWYADTGATEHMTEHKDWFSNFTNSS